MSNKESILQKYIICLFLIIPVLLWFPDAAQAHGPNDVALAYNADSQTLNVTISHAVSDPRRHYVSTVTITKNGEAVAAHEYTSQPESASFTYTYPLEVKTGDVVEVKAGCSYYGSKTEKLAIGK